MMTKRLGDFLTAILLFASNASIGFESEEWPVLRRIVKSGKILVGMLGSGAKDERCLSHAILQDR